MTAPLAIICLKIVSGSCYSSKLATKAGAALVTVVRFCEDASWVMLRRLVCAWLVADV